MKEILCGFLFFYFLTCFSHNAPPVTEASSDLKGFFGESLVVDIYQPAGSELVYRVNPNLHGPDLILKNSSGFLEIHEVKAYMNWAGKSAMQTTSGGTPTYELSQRWLNDWIHKTLANPAAVEAEKSAARAVSEAIKSNRITLIYDEINLTTQQFRASEIIQIGKDDISLKEINGLGKIRWFNQLWSKKYKEYLRRKTENLNKLISAPKIFYQSRQPISMQELLKLLPKEAQKNAGVKRINVHNALLTQNGKLLIAVKTGAKTGLMVFAAEAGNVVYEYANGDISIPEFQRKITDAAIKGAFVGMCTGVTVFLGATPTGWCVLAVCVGSYIIIDQSLKVWHRYQAKKYLTVDDLRSWGIDSNTILDIKNATILNIKKNTILDIKKNTILDIKK